MKSDNVIPIKNKMNIKELLKVDKRFIKYIWIIIVVLVIDHTIKITTYSSLSLHEEIRIIGDWIKVQLELNDGTSFAIPFQSEGDRYLKISVKIFLSFILLLVMLYFLNKKGPKLLIFGLALSFAGTLGNLIDRTFYGVLLNNALDIYPNKWFHGRVIDMFSLHLFEIQLPTWFPISGGSKYMFFEPVFNFADLVLFIGVIISILGLIKMRKKKYYSTIV
ncbi:MAG: signal peptidase II [Ignavibacteria bacterium]